MKFALFSDLHIHQWSEFANGDDRLNDCISVLTDVRAYCIKHGIWHCVFGGDLFHKRGVIHTRQYVQVANELLAFKDAGITFSATTGNHDQEDASGNVHALQPLMAGGLIRGVGNKGWRTFTIGVTSVTLFSYCDGASVLGGRVAKARTALGPDKMGGIGVFHHGFRGAKVGSVLEYEVKEPIDAKELQLDKTFSLVFSGHYHAHQSIQGIRRGWYIGSPLEHTRSDRTEDLKGFLVVDTDAMTFERVPLNRPRFVTLDVDDACANVAIARGNFVDIAYARVDDRLDECIAQVRAVGARGVNPIAEPQTKVQTKQRLNVAPTLAPSKVLGRYLKHRRKDIKRQKLDSDELKVLGLDLVKKAEGEL